VKKTNNNNSHDYRCVPMMFFPGLTYYYNILDAAGNKR